MAGISFLIILLWVAPTIAQVQQGGQITPGHIAVWQHNNLLKDGGGATGGPAGTNPTEIGITNTGTPFCITDGPIQPGTGYHQLCLGANTLNGYGLLSYNPYGGASPLPFDCEINGVFITNCFGGGGGGGGLTDVTGTLPIVVTSPTSTTRNVAINHATSSTLGTVVPDNISITIDSNGKISATGSGSGCVVGTGTQFQVVVFDPAGNCTASTIRDDTTVISATLDVGGGLPGDNVLLIDPQGLVSAAQVVAIGDAAGQNLAGFGDVVAIGNAAGNNAFVNNMVALGNSAGAGITGSQSNNLVAIGQSALQGVTTSNNLIGIGQGSLANAHGGNIVAIGLANAATTTINNSGDTEMVAIGDGNGVGMTGTGDDFVFIGNGNGSNNGSDNIVAIGNGSFGSAGSDIIAIGNGATGGPGQATTEVVAIGTQIGSANIGGGKTANSGSNVVALGYFAASGGTGHTLNANSGSNVIAIGNQVAIANTGSNVIAIGNGLAQSNTLSDVIYLGRNGATTTSLIFGSALVTAANCSGQPSHSVIATTGTGALVQCP